LIAPSQPVQDTVDQDDPELPQPADVVAVTEAEHVQDTVDQDDPELPQPADVVAVTEAGVNIEHQPDGTVIISLPPSFTEAVVSIPVYNTELVATGSDEEYEIGTESDASQDDAQVTEDESDQSDTVPSRSRKRQRQVGTWKQKVRVKKRNSGQSYSNSKGKLVPEKVRPTHKVCGCNNDHDCSSVTVGEQQEMFAAFWRTANFDLQTATLCSLIDERPVARRTVHDGSGPSAANKKKRCKQLSREYHLLVSGGRKKVCKTMFLTTFAVSNGRVDRALKNRRVNNGIVRPDQRGRHVKHQIPESDRQTVVEHIAMFPRYVSHYTRSHQNSREYLASHMNLKIMYRLYVEYCKEKSCVPVKESYYRQVFNSSFNLSFHQPLKDTCQKCDKFKILDETSPTMQLKAEQELHLRKAEKVREKLNSMKAIASTTHLCFTFDLEKTLITPSISVGVAYYKRQLATYNLGIHNISNNDAVMHMWHEGCASRGAAEVGSCLWKFVCDGVRDGATDITAFCDSCGGQNRNFKIASLLSHCVQSLPLDSFTLHYMQSGHSYLPNDADFGVIERAKRTARDVYVPEQWMELVRQARKHHPFSVVEMQLCDFIDLSVTAKQLVNRKKAKDGSPVKWLNIQSICFNKAEPQIMKYKYVCQDDMEWSELDLRRGREKNRTNSITTLVPVQQRKKIKKEKFDDLMSLKQYIPPVHHAFYDSLAVDGDDCSSDIILPDNAVELLPDEELELSEDEL